MNLYLRLIRVLFLSLFGKPVGYDGTGILKFRVWPNDIDINIHMNDGRYLSIMDLGRVSLTIRNGFMKTCLKNRWFPVIASVMVRYVRSIKPFQKYELHTEVLGWDEDWIYMSQKFMRRENLMAIGVIKAAILHRGKRIKASRIMSAMEKDLRPPKIPRWVREWEKSEEEMKNMGRTGKK